MTNASQYTNKLLPGSRFPKINCPVLNSNEVELGRVQQDAAWQIVVVYRGQHCPMCTQYLNQLEEIKQSLQDIGVSLIAVSADSEAQLLAHKEKLSVSYPIAFELKPEQMNALGLYVSQPRNAQETDHLFAEPAVYVVNEHGTVQVVDISNNPFVRPDLSTLLRGITWIKNPDNNYPIRGMHKG